MDFVPNYDANLFVTPQGIYRWMLSRVERWKQAQPQGLATERVWRARHYSLQTSPGDQVLSLVGERGMGKTWLLRHLAEDYEQETPAAVYIDLEERTGFPTPEEYLIVVKDRIRERCGNSTALLLLDAVPPDMDDHLRALEDEILKPHLVRHGSLVIMALVYPSRVCWRAPILRGEERLPLLPFESLRTRDQLRRLQQARLARDRLEASDVLESSGGLPLLNHLLATRDRIEAFELLLKYWLDQVPVDERGRMQSYLEAVCTLDALEYVNIQQSLDLYSRYQADALQYSTHASEVRNLLQKHWLVWSMPDAPGQIFMADGVRRAAREVLKARDSELFARLQQAA
jgi:hypothetical protein